MKLRDRLKDKLNEKEMELLKTAFDTVGNIAILEIDDALKKKRLIAKEVLDFVPGVTTVLNKAGIHSGEFRTQKMKWLAGKRTKEACVKENGVVLCLDVENVYYSVRSSTERKRISEQVKPGEEVLVMFSGCAPFPCVISRMTKAKSVTGIESNPIAHKYGLMNVEKNKLKNVVLLNKDVRKVRMQRKFDRILMPLPKTAEEFLPVAMKWAKKGTIIHLYTFGSDEELNEREKIVSKLGKVLQSTRCGQFSPRVYRWCIDFRVR